MLTNQPSMRCVIIAAKAAVISGIALALLPSPASADLLARYSFDTSDTSAPDVSGRVPPADATLSAEAVITESGYSGQGLDLGTSAGPNYAVANNPASLSSGLTQFTVTAWINMTQVMQNSSDDRLVSYRTSSGQFWEFMLRGNTATGIQLKLLVDGEKPGGSDGSGAVNTTNQNLYNQWSFVAVTYDGSSASDNVRFYIGSPDIDAETLGSAMTIDQGGLGAATSLVLGASGANLLSDRTPYAILDEISIYDEVLTIEQLRTIQTDFVIPEPGSSSLLGTLAVALVMRRRSRSRPH